MPQQAANPASRRMLQFAATLALALLVSACGVLFLPVGETTVKVEASVSIDGKTYTGTSIWWIRAKTQNGFPDSGINYHWTVKGDAIVFEIGPGEHLFWRPGWSAALLCAIAHEPDDKNFAEALRDFRGPCDAERRGAFTLVKDTPAGPPDFFTFVVNEKGRLRSDDGNPVNADITSFAKRRGFQINELRLSATSEPLGDGLTERFPWILQLPRTDICFGRYAGEDSYCRLGGGAHAQFFTTDLPTPK